MDDISKLLKEAKPLYFARKKRNNRIKTGLVMLVCVGFLGMFYPQKTDNNLESNFDYFLYGSEYTLSDKGSVIEEMGLPVDEYGLLMVS